MKNKDEIIELLYNIFDKSKLKKVTNKLVGDKQHENIFDWYAHHFYKIGKVRILLTFNKECPEYKSVYLWDTIRKSYEVFIHDLHDFYKLEKQVERLRLRLQEVNYDELRVEEYILYDTAYFTEIEFYKEMEHFNKMYLQKINTNISRKDKHKPLTKKQYEKIEGTSKLLDGIIYNVCLETMYEVYFKSKLLEKDVYKDTYINSDDMSNIFLQVINSIRGLDLAIFTQDIPDSEDINEYYGISLTEGIVATRAEELFDKLDKNNLSYMLEGI